ncbi:hypothetical protein V1514DRAFT_369043 [Lipomyces japonicus]|uniref:uncharacterized protein n=1 Tax=Lipomyces japonicus TaxID=56871 RepID=UPI0034CF4DA7
MNIPTRYRSLRRQKWVADAGMDQFVPELPTAAVSTEVQEGADVINTDLFLLSRQEKNVVTVKVIIFDNEATVTVPINSRMTASSLVVAVQQQALSLLGSYQSRSLRLIEDNFKLGLYRELYAFELISHVVDKWENSSSNSDMVNVFRIACQSSAFSLATTVESSLSEVVTPIAGYVRVLYQKKKKWNKRWVFTEDGVLYVSKKPNPKPEDKETICSLSNVNFHFVRSEKLSSFESRGRSDYVFALKLHQRSAIFENMADYVHYMCCDDESSFEMWKRTVQASRAVFIKCLVDDKLRELESSSSSSSSSHAVNARNDKDGDNTTSIAPLVPLISSDELRQPVMANNINKFSTDKQAKVTSHGTTTLPGSSASHVIIAPMPNHTVVTKDSLLDRLLHGETELSFVERKVRKSSEDDRGSRRPGELKQQQPALLSRSSSSRLSPPGTPSSTFSFEQDETITVMPSPSSTNRVHKQYVSPSPAPPLSPADARVLQPGYQGVKHNTVDDEDEDEDEPLYRRLQAIDLQIGSNNPFLDQEQPQDLLSLSPARLQIEPLRSTGHNNATLHDATLVTSFAVEDSVPLTTSKVQPIRKLDFPGPVMTTSTSSQDQLQTRSAKTLLEDPIRYHRNLSFSSPSSSAANKHGNNNNNAVAAVAVTDVPEIRISRNVTMTKSRHSPVSGINNHGLSPSSLHYGRDHSHDLRRSPISATTPRTSFTAARSSGGHERKHNTPSPTSPLINQIPDVKGSRSVFRHGSLLRRMEKSGR